MSCKRSFRDPAHLFVVLDKEDKLFSASGEFKHMKIGVFSRLLLLRKMAEDANLLANDWAWTAFILLFVLFGMS